MLPAFAEYLDANDIRVQAPTDVVFVCGGQTTDVSARPPRSLRDAFLKIPDYPVLRGRDLILAEDINISYLSRNSYSDLLTFETDLAQLTTLILLFCESDGSLAELGAFSMLQEISQRLLVVMRNEHYRQKSFIKLGPILSLENTYGESVIYVVDDDDLNITDSSLDNIRGDVLGERLERPIGQRLAETREPTKFNPERSGHIIKVIVGLVQEYGALTVDEIAMILDHMGLSGHDKKIDGYLLCAEAVNWVNRERKGAFTYFFALPVGDAATGVFSPKAPVRDKTRRRTIIRELWKEKDPDRYRGIVAASGVSR